MSRIHEALKKAELERALANPEDGAAATVVSAEVAAPADDLSSISAVHPAEPHPMNGAAAVARAPLATEVDSDATFDALISRLPVTNWTPDPKRMLFFASENHLPGSEEFRTLRSRLYQVRQKQKLQKVLITSAMPGEGKSFVAANLAQVIVRQQGRKALLIDGDLRWSQLHLALGAPSRPGLSDYLAGDVDEYAIVQRGPLENLYLIPGGKPVSNPAELIANGRIKKLLQRLDNAFDWIIIDSPPAVPVSDASVLADSCEGILMVVQAGNTPLDAVEKARQEFARKPLLGVVLNGVDPRATYGSYYYGVYGKRKRRKTKSP